MPSRARVLALVQMVEANDFVGALQTFYAPDASMQENGDPPRKGLETLVQGERMLLAAFKSIQTKPGSEVVIDGDAVVIRWTFTFTYPDGSAFDLEELAYQTWRDDVIVVERFFYDSRQKVPPKGGPRA